MNYKLLTILASYSILAAHQAPVVWGCIYALNGSNSASEDSVPRANATKHAAWKYFEFNQMWPPSFCSRDFEVTSAVFIKKKCYINPHIKGWTIHGLWPTSHGAWPFNCNKHFSIQEIQTLLPQLRLKWPMLDAHEQFWLWKHEWIKHGSCSTDLPATRNEFLYFKKVLTLHSEFNIERVLKAHNITPSWNRTYSTDAIERAVMTGFNLTTRPVLTWNRSSKHISGIQVCLNKSFALRSCQRKSKKHGDVIIPPYPRTEASDME